LNGNPVAVMWYAVAQGFRPCQIGGVTLR
jgi:hypothetical protein